MLAILVSLALLIVLTFRKINIVVVGIAAAAVMALLSGQPVVTAVTDTYMTGAAQFVRDNFLLFFFSVLFGKVMEETGAAASIAKFLAELLAQARHYQRTAGRQWTDTGGKRTSTSGRNCHSYRGSGNRGQNPRQCRN